MLLIKSPEYWAREATLTELQAEVRKLDTFDERAAEVLDSVYLDRCIRILARVHDSSRDDALALADHLERVAHDSVRDELDGLERPYFARWRLLSEIMSRAAMRLEVPLRILERRHVREILLQLHRAGGRVAQGDLMLIPNEGQRSVTLKLMEQWDLIARHANGRQQDVSITDLGRLAIHQDIAAEGPARSNMATSLNNRALFFQHDSGYAQAEPLYERALRIREKALGPEHPDIATSLDNLAGIYQDQGAYGRAEPLYERALHIREKALGSEHPDVATSLDNLARLYQAQGAHDQAEPLYNRALRIREHVLGPEHPNDATSLEQMIDTGHAGREQ